MAAAGKHVALVTGAAGNLGGQIAKKLARSGRYRAVVGTDVSKFTSVQSDNDPQHQQHYVGGVDLTDRTAVEALFQRVGEEKGAGADGDGQLVVVHVAAWPGPAQEPPLRALKRTASPSNNRIGLEATSPAALLSDNVASAYNVFEAAAEAGAARVVFSSSAFATVL